MVQIYLIEKKIILNGSEINFAKIIIIVNFTLLLKNVTIIITLIFFITE